MSDTTTTSEAKVSCAVCIKEIPVSEAKCAEAREYVSYFCGLECYDQWLAQQTDKAEPENKSV